MAKISSYTLYYSEEQKAHNEAEQLNKLSPDDPSFGGSYIFADSRTNTEYEATELVADISFLGVRLKGKPTYKDARLVAAHLSANTLRRLRRVAL